MTTGAAETATNTDAASRSEGLGARGDRNERRMTDWLDRHLEGHWRAAEVALYVVTAIGAWIVRFVQDDAFITYRYARNLARGNGLVFNEGERVEGYTNFLWTVIHYIPEKLGWSTPIFGQLVGIACLLGATAVTLRFARRIFGSESMALLTAMVLVANVTFLAYGTGGLETMLQALLVTSVGALLIPMTIGAARARPLRHSARMVGAGVCGGLAILTRLDSAVLVATWVAVFLVSYWRGRPPAERDVVGLAGAAAKIAVPAAVLLIPWFVWKLDFYGNLLPNTFYAKSAGSKLIPFGFGVMYLFAFFVSYGAFLLIPRLRKSRGELWATPGVPAVLAVLPVWFLYICVVGGDFMEYRFMVPIMPVLAMVGAYLVNRFTRPRLQVVLVISLLVFSGVHWKAPSILPYPVLTFEELSHWPNDSDTSWKGMGEFLNEQFPGGPGVDDQPVIAVAPLGLISYYSDLTTIDMLGLTDPYIAREGYAIEPYVPGHVRMAPVEYLMDRDVNLVLAQPALVDVEPGRESYRLSELVGLYPSVDLNDLPDDASVIEIPRRDGRRWVMIYLQPNDKVDAAIEANGWDVFPIERTCVEEDMQAVEPGGPLASIINHLSRMIGDRTCPPQ